MKHIRQIIKINCLLCFVLVLLAGCGSTKFPAESNEAETQGLEETTIAEGAVEQAAGEETAAMEETTVAEETVAGEETTVTEETITEETNTEETMFSTAELAEPTPATISLLMVGDILLHTPVEEAAKQEDGSYNFDAIFANVQEEIQAADLAIVNQEVILGGEDLGISGYPAFNAPFAVGDALMEAGFDVHIHAMGDASVKQSAKCLAAAKKASGTDSRNVIAHLMILDEEDSQTMADADIIANCTYSSKGAKQAVSKAAAAFAAING